MLGRSISYYLDDTILALVWQQDEHGAIGTFAEVFVADASQLRRKLAEDTFGSYQYYTPSEFAAQTNAVLACSGDFYNSGRSDYGLYVYNGELMRCNLSAGQSCLFSGDGDMLFVYENQFADEEEARRFIRDNQVPFSLTFGPVIADHGKDVTPQDYYFGEVTEGYARCAVGQLGHLHYLMMTINVEYPDHDVYVTLRQAADSMLAHGCVNAYTLDGGQTGSILIGGRLINPVQFGTERQMSDIFYFATAPPENA
jgi:exopolysaccharide biosynthesis protein